LSARTASARSIAAATIACTAVRIAEAGLVCAPAQLPLNRRVKICAGLP
jgi:hypothetical protein